MLLPGTGDRKRATEDGDERGTRDPDLTAMGECSDVNVPWGELDHEPLGAVVDLQTGVMTVSAEVAMEWVAASTLGSHG